MFEISFSEVAIVVLTSTLILGPKESIKFLNKLKRHIVHMRSKWEKYKKYLLDEMEDGMSDLENIDNNYHKNKKYLIGKDGKAYKTYDINSIKKS